VANEAQLKALAKGRGKGRFQSLPEISKQGILDGLARGRVQVKEWKKSPEGVAHLEKLAKIGTTKLAALLESNRRMAVCVDCGVEFETFSPKAKCCSRKCEQRNRRARETACRPPKPKYQHPKEAREKMAAAKRGKKQLPETIAKRNASRAATLAARKTSHD
jgi:hypothetical protein